MRAGVGDAGLAVDGQHGDRGAGQHEERRHQDGDRHHLHLEALDLLADVFRRAADHEAGDEDREQREHEHAVESRTYAAEHDLAQLDQPHWHEAAQWRERVVHRVDRTAGSGRRDRREERAGGDAEAGLLAFHVAARLQRARRLVHADGRQQWIALLLERHRAPCCDDEQNRHRREHRPPLAHVAHDPAECETQAGGNQENREHFQEIRDRVRVLERMRGIRVQEAATVGAKLLDRFLRRNGTHGQGLGGRGGRLGDRVAFLILQRLAVRAVLRIVVFDRLDQRDVDVGCEVLHDTLAYQPEGQHEGHRDQHPHGDSGEVDPEIADGSGRMAGKAADQRKGDGDAGCRGKEILHRERRHLRQVTHRRLAGVALPVGVCDEADRGIERRVRAHGTEALRIERQPRLDALDRVDDEHAQAVEHQYGERVLEPRHFLGVDAQKAKGRALDSQQWRGKPAVAEGGQPRTHRPYRRK